MKRFLSISFLILSMFSKVNSQVLSVEEVIGKWKIVSVGLPQELINAPEFKEKAESLAHGFIGKLLEFKADRHFSFDTGIFDLEINEGHWKHNNETGSFLIQEWEDRKTDKKIIMEIMLRNEDGKTMLLFSDADMMMEVVKQ
jgi:hypothetical protein